MRNFKSYAGEQRVGPFHKVTQGFSLSLSLFSTFNFSLQLQCELRFGSISLSSFLIASVSLSLQNFDFTYGLLNCFGLTCDLLNCFDLACELLNCVDLFHLRTSNCFDFRVSPPWWDLTGAGRATSSMRCCLCSGSEPSRCDCRMFQKLMSVLELECSFYFFKCFFF